GTEGLVRLWVPTTGEVFHTLAGHCGPVHAVAFAPDGKTLASAGEDGAVQLWDPTTGALRRSCREHRDAVLALTFSTHGKVLASASKDRRVLLWHADTGQPFGDYNMRTVVPLAVAFVDEKRLDVACEAGAVRLFDFTAHKLLRDYRGMTWAVNALA